MKCGVRRAAGTWTVPAGGFPPGAAGLPLGHRLLEPVARRLGRRLDGGAAEPGLPAPGRVRGGLTAGCRPPVLAGRPGTDAVRRIDQGNGPDHAVRQAQVGIGNDIIAGGAHPRPAA